MGGGLPPPGAQMGGWGGGLDPPEGQMVGWGEGLDPPWGQMVGWGRGLDPLWGQLVGWGGVFWCDVPPPPPLTIRGAPCVFLNDHGSSFVKRES